jgi:hypothetical protein
MDVDEPGRDGHAARIDLDGPRAGNPLSDRRDPAAGNGDIGFHGRAPASVDDVTAANHEVVCGAVRAEDRRRADQADDGAGGTGQEITTGGQSRLSTRD